MAFSIRNPELARIEDRYNSLKHIIEEYPILLQEYHEKQEKILEREAKECSEGDPEVFQSIYSQFLCAFDNTESHLDCFYQSIFVLAFAFYKSAISFLGKKLKTGEFIKAICKSKNINLSKETEKYIDFIDNKVKVLRNQLIHNNYGKPKQINTIKALCREYSELSLNNDIISLSGTDLLNLSIEKELYVLKELYNKLGYKHKQTKDQKNKESS